MSEEPKPEPITFDVPTSPNSPSPTFTSAPMLTGTTATLSGGGSLAGAPMGQENVKFVMGPNGQMIAVQKEPFVWSKFLIGFAVPVFLMIVPWVLALVADEMDNYDDEYEYESIDFELVNGTAYTATYSLDPSKTIEWCNPSYPYEEYRWQECHHAEDNSEMHLHEFVRNNIPLIQENGTTNYSTNFTLEDHQSIADNDFHLWDSMSKDGWYSCDYDDSDPNEKKLRIFHQTWNPNGPPSREQVGQWNESTGIIQFNDGEDREYLEIEIIVEQEIGEWSRETGIFSIDNGDQLEDAYTLRIETIDQSIQDEIEANQALSESLFTATLCMCCLSPLVAIALIVYGFAATGGKPVGLGAVLALVCYPVIGFIGAAAL